MQSASSSSIKESKSVKKTPSKTPAKGAESKDSDIVQSSKAEQPSMYVMHDDANEPEQLSIPDSGLLEVPRGDKVKSGSTSRRTSFNSEASGNESDVSEVNNADVEESWCSVLKKDIKNFIEEKKEKGENWWIELLGTKVGFDAVAKKWIREEKAKDVLGQLPRALDELVVRLVCEIDISPGTAFEAKRIFSLFESLSDVMEKEQRRKIVELIVQKDKTNLLKLICDKENKNREHKRKDGSSIVSSNNRADRQYFWKEELGGFDTTAELLNYAINQDSPGSVRLLVDRIYSALHPIYNRGRYLDDVRYLIRYSCSVNGESIKSAEKKEEFFKELLEKVIEKGFTDSLLVMLGGDIAQLILKMSKDKFEACDELQDIYNMTEIAVIRVLQSLVQLQDEKKAEERKALIKELIEKGATVEEKNITEEDLIALAGEHKIKLPGKGAGKDYIKKIFRENRVNVSKVKRKLSQDVLYGIIVELFFYQHEQIYAIAEGIVENKLIFHNYYHDSYNKDKVKELLRDLAQDIEGEVLKVIIQLNKAGRAQRNLFSRLVFKEIMLVEPDKGKNSEINVENIEKIIKACADICREPMQELVQGMEINEINSGIHSILTLIGVKLPDSIAVLDTPSFNHGDTTCEGFQKEIDSVYNNPSSAPAFSGFSRRIIDMLKAGDEKLPEAINEVEKNVKALDDKDSIDVNDTFQALEMLHPKIGKEQCRKIVELIVQEDKTHLLKLICSEENKNRGHKRKDGSSIASSNNRADRQYFWKGELSGFDTTVELLEYAINQGSPGSVRLLVDGIYSTLHPIYNKGQYLDSVKYLKDYSCSVNSKSIQSREEKEEFFKELLEKVIEKGFADSLLGMLGGDTAQLILKMSKDKFEKCGELQDIYNMTEIAVIHVLQSLVQPQAEDRKALIKELIEKGATIKEEDITAKDLIALAGEHEVKSSLKGKGKDFIKDILQTKGVDVSKVKRKLSQDVLYGIIVELFFYQHEQIYAIAEGTNKLIFYDGRDDSINKDKVKELLSDLTQDIEGAVLKVITQLNRVGRESLFSRLVFKEIILVEPDKGKNSEINVENVEKIIKGCVAICKEPMQKLVDGLREKGVTISEKVMDVLKLVGVDSLALEKSMTSAPENSNVVLNRNIPSLQIEDFTLSSNSRSEKGTSDELRQQSAETSRDPPEIRVIEPAEVKAKVLSSVSPSSKVVEEKNKSFMQTSCGQGENSSYNKGENSHRHSGEVGSISRRLGMPRADLRLARQRKKKNKEGVASHKSIQAVYEPPSFQDLSEANRMMYIKKALDEFVLSYSTLSYRSLYGANRLPQSLNESMGSSGSYEDEQEFNDLFVNNSCYDKYEDAINKLKNDDILEAQKLLIELVEQGVAPAAYVRALVLFKELVKQCDVHNNVEKNTVVMREGADDIKEAVELLEFCTDEMKPASSFSTGMMKAFNVGECRQFMGGAWEDDLVHVVNVARIPGDSEFEQSVLHGISSSGWDAEECGIGMKEKREDIKKMFKYSLYEIVQGMLSKSKFDSTVVENSFITLSKGHDFPEGLYGYGFALVRNKVAGDFQKNMEKAIDLLDRASSQGHEGAKLLLGVLPFKNDAYCETRRERVSCIRVLEGYVRKSDDLCLMNKKNVDKMALCLAAGYCSRKSAFLEHNEQKAKEILELRGLHEEWDNLQQKSKMIFDDDSSAFLAPLSSTKNTARSSFSGFPDDYDAINKTPASELGDASVQNQGVSGKFKQ